MKTEKQNPDHKLVSTIVEESHNERFVEFVFGQTNEGENKGLELYFYRALNEGHYYSKRYPLEDIPNAFYREIANSLSNHIVNCPEGHKISLR